MDFVPTTRRRSPQNVLKPREVALDKCSSTELIFREVGGDFLPPLCSSYSKWLEKRNISRIIP